MGFISGNVLIFLQLFIALILGAFVGIERTLAGKTAGMRTFALVSVGSALFTIIGMTVSRSIIGVDILDPLRVVGAIVTGVGFIGAGLIIVDREGVHGLTTAAGMWVAAAIGASVGAGLYWVALFMALLMIFTFVPMWFLEEKVRNHAFPRIEKTIVEPKDDSNI